MAIIITLLIIAILDGCLVFIDGALTGIVPLSLYTDNYMTTMFGTNFFTAISQVVFGFGVSLIVLKFVKKGFDTYVMWSGAPAEEEPYSLVLNFFKAMAVALCFPVIYGWMAEIVTDMTGQLLAAIAEGTDYDWAGWVTGISTLGIVTAIISLIFFICFFMLYFQFIMRGLEILILRIGVPIACAGLIDNDAGVFKNYITIFFKSMLTVVVQISLAKLGVGLMFNMHLIWGVACMILAIKTPKFLNEFVIPSTNGGGGAGHVVSNAYHSVKLVSMIKGIK